MTFLLDDVRDLNQVVNESLHLCMPSLIVRRAQDGGGVDGCDDMWRERGFYRLASFLSHAKILAEQSLCGAGAQADQHFGFDSFEFRIEPGTAGFDLRGSGFLVNAALAAFGSGPLEMFDDVGHVNFSAVDPRFGESLIEQLAGGPNKGTSLTILLIAWLFPDKHDGCARRPLPEHSLCGRFPEITCVASRCGTSQS